MIRFGDTVFFALQFMVCPTVMWFACLRLALVLSDYLALR